MSEQVQQHILRKYSLVKKLGSGAYGHVWKVTDKKTNQTLALKKIFDAFQHSTDAQRTFREIVFLHELNHPNIIKLHNVIKAENDKDLYLVFQFMEADLHNAIGQKILKDIHNRFIIYQIVKGIKFLHSAEIIHRDLKPSNVLLNSDCHLKICDFGLARSLVADREGTDMILTEEVATRWYRAPQVLLGSQTYQKSADIWSIGCILGEILIGKPLFPGNSTLNQLERIISFTGHPSKEDIMSLNSEIAHSMISSISQNKVKNIKEWFKPDTPQEAISLICRMLEFNPKKRPTAEEILKSSYLSQFHNAKEQYDSAKVIYPPVSDNKKLNLKQYRQLIYERIKKIYKSEDEITNNTVLGTSGNNSTQKLSSHSSGNNRQNYEYTSYSSNKHNKEELYAQDTAHTNTKDREEYNTLTGSNNTPIRHSAGKMKTASYSSSCSSFNQFVNNSNNSTGVVSHGAYSSFYGHGNPSGHEVEDYNKIQKKSSLKEILKNKKYKEDAGSSANTGNSYTVSGSINKYSPSSTAGTTASSGSMNISGGAAQQNYIQKYYKKPSMNASIYKQNKLGRHV